MCVDMTPAVKTFRKHRSKIETAYSQELCFQFDRIKRYFWKTTMSTVEDRQILKIVYYAYVLMVNMKCKMVYMHGIGNTVRFA